MNITPEIQNYAKGMNASEKVLNWLEKNIKDWDTSEVEHIIDYLVSDKAPKRLDRATYEQMKKNTEKWTESLMKKGNNIKETEEDIETVLDFKEGFKIVKLISKKAYEREGNLMRHCVASYFGKEEEIYSLRDKTNVPHATLSSSSQQIKGKGNGSIHPKYISYVVKFLEFKKIEVRDSEMQNLGYFDFSKFKKYLHKDCAKQFFKKKYWYKDGKLIDKEGREFFCFGLLDYIPLVSETKTSIKINFELPNFIKGSIGFIHKNLIIKKASSGNNAKQASSGNNAQQASSGYNAKQASSGNNAKQASSGDYAQQASSGNNAQQASSGYNAKQASSGDYAQQASSGNNAQQASSGYNAKQASSGDYAQQASSGNNAQQASSGYNAKQASSGDYAQQASSGNYAKQASSGNNAQQASSGYNAKQASSGNNAQQASSGYNAKQASSGDYAQQASSGNSCVCAAIGINSRIKAKKGSWITLAEYANNGKPICVKSVQIDGKKLKEDIWYCLKNKRFMEVE